MKKKQVGSRGTHLSRVWTRGIAAVLGAAMLLVGGGCATGEAETGTAGAGLSQSGDEEWQTLFDGSAESLEANWRGYRMTSVPDTWTAEDEVLTFSGSEPQGHHLITNEQFGDMVLELEWKINEGENSGIFYLVTEGEPVPEYTGPEYQIVAGRTAGGNFALHDPTQQVARPAGEWNTARIVVEGRHVEHWLNDEKVVEYELETDEWERLKADSKFDGRPYGLFTRGHIVLQDHGNPAWFRNIRVRRLN